MSAQNITTGPGAFATASDKRDEVDRVAPRPRVGLGDTVILEGVMSNSASEQPAIVTRVWSQDCVNLKVLLDCGGCENYSSVERLGTFTPAEGYVAIGWRPRD